MKNNQKIEHNIIKRIKYDARNINTKGNQYYTETFYETDKILDFDKKKEFLLFENKNNAKEKRTIIILCMLLTGMGIWCIKQIYNYQNRYKITIPFYFYGAYKCLTLPILATRQFSRFVHKIALHQDGKHVSFYFNRMLIFKSKQIINIKYIKRPDEKSVNPYTADLNKLGFKLEVKDNIYVVPRKGTIIDQQLLPAVLNANYIIFPNMNSQVIIEDD